MSKTQILIPILVGLIGCTTASSNGLESNVVNSVGSDDANLDSTAKKTSPDNLTANQEEIREDNYSISFEDFEIIIHDFSAYREQEFQPDTLEIDNEIGKGLDRALIQIIPRNESDRFELSISSEQNLTVYVDEREFEDLSDWTRISDIIALNDSSKYFYRAPDFKRKEKEEQLNVDFEEIKKQVIALKGGNVNDELLGAKSIQQLPVELWISRVFLKIRRINPSGETFNQILVFNTSWGC